MRKSSLAVAFVLAAAVSVNAQNINVDFDTSVAGGGGDGAPAATYGAAAGALGAGCWNLMEGTTQTSILNAGTGAACTPTPVTVTRSSALGGNFAFNNANTSGDRELLLDDGQDLSAVTGPLTITFTGLINGPYDVYTYAVAPDFTGTDTTAVTVNGVTLNSTGPIPLAGFIAGQTHTLHANVAVVAGTLTISVNEVAPSFGTINGIQLVLIPEPSSLALLGLGALGLIRRRR